MASWCTRVGAQAGAPGLLLFLNSQCLSVPWPRRSVVCMPTASVGMAPACIPQVSELKSQNSRLRLIMYIFVTICQGPKMATPPIATGRGPSSSATARSAKVREAIRALRFRRRATKTAATGGEHETISVGHFNVRMGSSQSLDARRFDAAVFDAECLQSRQAKGGFDVG